MKANTVSSNHIDCIQGFETMRVILIAGGSRGIGATADGNWINGQSIEEAGGYVV